MMKDTVLLQALLLLAGVFSSQAWASWKMAVEPSTGLSRRSFAAAALVSTSTPAAFAQPTEFKSIDTQAPGADGQAPFKTLPSGVRIKDFKVGTGADEVKPGARVSVYCTGKLLNLNGVKFYSTKEQADPNELGYVEPLVFVVGKGQAIPGLEEGMMGMKKGSIRRIIVPAELGYANNPTLEPQPTTTENRRALESVIKNPRRDSTLLFDVQVEKVK